MTGRRRTLVILVLWSAALQAQQPLKFRYERPVVVDKPGPQRLAIDVPLLTGGSRFTTIERAAAREKAIEGRDERQWRASEGLSDLRLFEPSGREVPHLLIHPSASTTWMPATVLPIAAVDTRSAKTSGVEADFGSALVVDMIRVDGIPPPFLKRVVLEGSGDRRHWTLLAGEGTLFDLPEDQLRQLALSFRAGPYRFLRVTWDDSHSGRVPLPQAVFGRRVDAAQPPAPPLFATASAERRPSEPGRSRYRIVLPGGGLPIIALSLEVQGSHVFRTAVVTESMLQGGRAAPVEIGRATLRRVARDGVTAADLRIPVRPPREARIDLVVEDGNNAPLEISRVHLEMAELPWIYFEATTGSITARYGDPSARAPRYDLEAMRETVNVAGLPEARWGAPREITAVAAPVAASAMPETGAPLDRSLFEHRRAVPESGAGLVAVPLDVAVLAHSRGPSAQFADVRVVDRSGRQVPYLLELLQEPLALDLTLRIVEPKAASLKTSDSGNRSIYAAPLPYPNLLPATLVLETSARVFSRSVTAGVEHPADRRRRDPWFEPLAVSPWVHSTEDVAAPALSLQLAGREAERLVVAVDEGDNSALPIGRARLLLPAYRLRLFHPGGALQLLYGRDDLAPPRYDLALLAPQVMGAEARELLLPAEEPSSGTPPPSFVSPRVFWMGLTIAVVALGGLIVRLIRSRDASA